jgi:hypothetical protein
MGSSNGNYGPVTASGDVNFNGTTPGLTAVYAISGNSNTVSMKANQYNFPAATASSAVQILMQTPASDVATGALTITGQSPYASATVNMTGGPVQIQLAQPVGTGLPAQLQILYGSTVNAIFAPNRQQAGSSALNMNPGATNVQNNAYTLMVKSTGDTYLNAPAGTSVNLMIGNATALGCSTTALTFYSGWNASSASAGSTSLPALCSGFINIYVGATQQKIPVYNP